MIAPIELNIIEKGKEVTISPHVKRWMLYPVNLTAKLVNPNNSPKIQTKAPIFSCFINILNLSQKHIMQNIRFIAIKK